MRFNDTFKYPRLYVDTPITQGQSIALPEDQAHYLKNVMRKKDGETIRIFNGKDGEWLAALNILGKKETTLTASKHFKTQPESHQAVRLYFAPIKKNHLSFLIEKAVELGVTELYPVITNRTENRKLNIEKLEKQIIEAAEQCERLTIPALHTPQNLPTIISKYVYDTPLYWAAERMENTKMLADCTPAQSFLIGPEGGFDEQETALLAAFDKITPIDLGEQILRAETAAILCLCHAKLSEK